jgi:succinyl-CoA synthetase beta subunit
VANGIVTAINQLKPSVPIVVRLTGTNEEKAHKILRSVNLPYGDTLDEVVKKAIDLAGIAA